MFCAMMKRLFVAIDGILKVALILLSLICLKELLVKQKDINILEDVNKWFEKKHISVSFEQKVKVRLIGKDVKR